MNTRIFLTLAALVVASLMTGCNTFRSRARERSATFEQLSPAEQQRLQRGTINVGDNEDMVYIALGSPDERRDITTADGTQAVWIYKSYWQQYEGTAWLGYRRYVVPTARGFAIFHEPVTQDVYRTHADDRIRVTFDRRGVVTTVEQIR
jgi:outer membrane protein assembly factor BamE (lipoprotein component of BamABCDE complex)